MTLAGVRKMKEGLDAAGLKPFLMAQPLGYWTTDASKQGFIDLPEFPFGKAIYYIDNIQCRLHQGTIRVGVEIQNDCQNNGISFGAVISMLYHWTLLLYHLNKD